MIRYLLPLVIFIILTGFLYAGLSLNPRDIGSTRLDKPAPTFSLPQLNDPNAIFSDKDFLGKVSLFNAWASWCVSCRHEHPLLMQLQKKGHVIYGLNYKDTLTDAQNLLNNTGNPYLASGFDAKGRVGIDWGVTGTPETFIVDKKGFVRYKHIGPLTVDLLQTKILPLINDLAAK